MGHQPGAAAVVGSPERLTHQQRDGRGAQSHPDLFQRPRWLCALADPPRAAWQYRARRPPVLLCVPGDAHLPPSTRRTEEHLPPSPTTLISSPHATPPTLLAAPPNVLAGAHYSPRLAPRHVPPAIRARRPTPPPAVRARRPTSPLLSEHAGPPRHLLRERTRLRLPLPPHTVSAEALLISPDLH